MEVVVTPDTPLRKKAAGQAEHLGHFEIGTTLTFGGAANTLTSSWSTTMKMTKRRTTTNQSVSLTRQKIKAAK
jgi:hypothetical protein